MEYMRAYKHPKGFIYITNTHAWIGILVFLRELAWILSGGSDACQTVASL